MNRLEFPETEIVQQDTQKVSKTANWMNTFAKDTVISYLDAGRNIQTPAQRLGMTVISNNTGLTTKK